MPVPVRTKLIDLWYGITCHNLIKSFEILAFIFVFPFHGENKECGFVSDFDKGNPRGFQNCGYPIQAFAAVIHHAGVTDGDGTSLPVRAEIFIEQI